ncbi:aminopeptidase N [Drosophila guanche]|uniref:Aminopeptidase n=1 Tax=Drosophila guanche TaxID=7266 RepID=A0A3B0JQY4_DROGU|nr:aminopeptidase N [Drosophila guanche]SPP73558.1 blast:Aminopeptidase N [Drosophila guanche]
MLGSTAICCLSLMLLLPSASLAVYDHHRLPTSLEPLHYDLRILTHLNATDLRFEGDVSIDLRVLQSTQNITLHARNLRINESRISLTGKGFTATEELQIELNELYDYYILHLCRELELGEIYQLTLHFESLLNATESGYYNSSYTNAETKEKHYMAVTQFSPTFARQAFPCFDEPYWKATFNVTLGYHKSYTGLSNMPIRRCHKHESLHSYVWCEHEQLLRTSAYLVAFAVHDLTNAATVPSDTKHGVIFRNWLQPKAVDQGNVSIEMAPKVLGYFEDLFQLDFPLRKIDQFAAPTHRFSAMENWGLVTFKEDKFVHIPGVDLQEPEDSKAKTLAHEYAHQWFGNIVTMKWWNDLWLKEGPSTYFTYLALDALQPASGRGERFIGKDLARFFRQDSASSVRAISREVKDPAQILGQFTEYVYEKGALIVRMLHKLLGEEAFFLAIRSYLAQHSFGNVAQADLWQSMQQAAKELKVLPADFQLAPAMDTWTLQGGYPLVTAIRDYETGRVSLNQTRFYLERGLREAAATADNCWWVPLSFVSQTQPDFEQTRPQFWLECPRQTVELPSGPSRDGWLILNPQVSAIYRVNYDEQNWRMIINSLRNDPNFGDIHVLNRVQLMDDLMALGGVQLLSYDWAFDLFEYLQREEHFLPWDRSLGLLNRIGMLLTGQQAKEFRVYMAKLLTLLYRRLPKLGARTGMSSTIRDMALTRLTYTQACRYRVDDCNEQAKLLIMRHLNTLELPADLQEVAYCTTIEQGGEAEFQHVWQLFRNSTHASQQGMWASALGCSRNISLLRQFLDYTLESEKKETNDCYLLAVQTTLTREHLGVEAADHTLSHAKRLNEKFKKRQLTSLLQTLAGGLHKPQDSERLREQLKDLKQFEKPLQKALELVRVNQQWQRDCSADFSQALAKYIQ